MSRAKTISVITLIRVRYVILIPLNEAAYVHFWMTLTIYYMDMQFYDGGNVVCSNVIDVSWRAREMSS